MAEYILEDWYGKEQTFDKETIYVQGTDGELMPFTHGAGNPVIEPLNVTENGTYEVPEGVDGYSPVTVNVAGSGGSGDSGATLENPIVATGTFVPTGDTITFKHNLGVVPDCVVIRNLNSISGVVPSNCVLYAIGFRKDIPFGLSLQNHLLQATSGCQNISANIGIEESGNDMAGFRNANATSITVGGWVGKLDTTAEYEWKATRILP